MGHRRLCCTYGTSCPTDLRLNECQVFSETYSSGILRFRMYPGATNLLKAGLVDVYVLEGLRVCSYIYFGCFGSKGATCDKQYL